MQRKKVVSAVSWARWKIVCCFCQFGRFIQFAHASKGQLGLSYGLLFLSLSLSLGRQHHSIVIRDRMFNSSSAAAASSRSSCTQPATNRRHQHQPHRPLSHHPVDTASRMPLASRPAQEAARYLPRRYQSRSPPPLLKRPPTTQSRRHPAAAAAAAAAVLVAAVVLPAPYTVARMPRWLSRQTLGQRLLHDLRHWQPYMKGTTIGPLVSWQQQHPCSHICNGTPHCKEPDSRIHP